jgi:hypothetical protein
MVRIACAGFLPCPDLLTRQRMRREALTLVSLPSNAPAHWANPRRVT